MRSHWKRSLMAGMTVALITAMAVSNAQAASSASYSRYINAGSSDTLTTKNQTWEPQTGFIGGIEVFNIGVKNTSLINNAITSTGLTSPTAFALPVPNGTYTVGIYYLPTNTSAVTVSSGAFNDTSIALGKASQQTKVKLKTLTAEVTSGSLTMSFSPANSRLDIVALTLRASSLASTPIPSTVIPATTTTTAPKSTTTTVAHTTTTVAPTTTSTVPKATTTTAVAPTTTTTAPTSGAGGMCNKPVLTKSPVLGKRFTPCGSTAGPAAAP